MKNKRINIFGLGVFLLLVPGPIVAGIVLAFRYATGLTGVLATGFTLTPLKKVLGDGEVFVSLGYSFYIALAAIGMAAVISLGLIAVFKDRLMKPTNVYWFYLPLGFPAIVTAFLSFQMLGKSGIFSRMALQLHIISGRDFFPDLINDRFAIGIILTHLLMALPFFILYFSNLYAGMRVQALESVAASLGASRKQIARRIVTPVLVRQAMPVLLLYFIFVSGSYEIPLILGRQTPQMISVLAVRKLQRFNLGDMPDGYWITLIYLIFVILLLAVFFRFRKKSNPL